MSEVKLKNIKRGNQSERRQTSRGRRRGGGREEKKNIWISATLARTLLTQMLFSKMEHILYVFWMQTAPPLGFARPQSRSS